MVLSKASAFALYSPLVGNDLKEIRDFLLTPTQFCFCLFVCFYLLHFVLQVGFVWILKKLLLNFLKMVTAM